MAGKVSLFNVISPAFFSLLSSPNKETNFLLIAQTEQSFGKSLTIDRKKLVDDLADFIKMMHISSVDEETFSEEMEVPFESQNPQTKASNFVRLLETRGWLDRDQDEDLNPIVQRTDAFIAIYSALCDLLENEVNAKEFATPLLSLYRNIRGFDMGNATASMQAVETDSKDLEHALLSINSRIKRFVSQAMSDVHIGEKEILTKLTVDYQRLTAYIAFHNLMTTNNPNKYSAEIIQKIYELSDPSVIKTMVDNYLFTKDYKNPTDEQRREAKDYFTHVLGDVEEQMNDIEGSLNVILGRNHAYVRSSSERIRFRLNNERNIKGEITGILKRIKAAGDSAQEVFDDPFLFYSFRQSDGKSLYTAKAAAKIAPKKIPFTRREISEEAKQRAEEIIRQRNTFSLEAINSFVLEGLGKRRRMLASEVPVQNVDDFVKLILISVFSANKDARYTIGEPNGNKFQTMGFEVDDYEIRVKEKKQ